MNGSAWTVGPYGINATQYPSIGINSDSVITKSDLLVEAEKCSLRSSKEISSYHVKGLDEKFGHIQGYLLNTQSLAIEFFIIDTMNYLPSKKVLLRPEWMKDISWESKTVKFPFSKDLIKSAPSYKIGDLNEKLITDSNKHFQSALYKHRKDQKQVYDLQKKRDLLNHSSNKESIADHAQ